MSDAINPLRITPPPGTPEANNPLAPDWMRNIGSAAADWMQRQHTLSQQMGLEDPATGLPTALGLRNALAQYPAALVAGSGGSGARWKPGSVDVNGVTAYINPSKADMARMMQAAPEHRLRAFYEAPNEAIWPAFDATHADMAEPLGFTENADNRQYHGRVGPPDDDYPVQAGRFSFFATGDPKPPR